MYPALYDVDGDDRADLVLQWRNHTCGPSMEADCSVVATWHRNLTEAGLAETSTTMVRSTAPISSSCRTGLAEERSNTKEMT